MTIVDEDSGQARPVIRPVRPLRAVALALVMSLTLAAATVVAPATSQAALLLQTLSPTSGSDGLFPLLRSSNPCPPPPVGKVGAAVITVGQFSEAAATDGAGNWTKVVRMGRPSPGTEVIRTTCSYGDRVDPFNMVPYAAYQDVTFTRTADPRPTLSVSPGLLTSAGAVTVTSTTPCPVPGQRVEVDFGLPSSDPADEELQQFTTSNVNNGYWAASIDLSPYASRLRSGSMYIFVRCEGTSVPNLDYVTSYVSVKLPPKHYVAMGDSYSSGEGNPAFDEGTDTFVDKCHRSSLAWPRVMASAQGIGYDIDHIACSGATTGQLTAGRYGETGQIATLKAVAAIERVDLVTLTIGGNDAGFSTILGSCRFYPTCLTDLPSNMATIDNIANKLQSSILPSIMNAVAKYPGARVVLVGYPRLFPTSQSLAVGCGWLTDTKRRRLNTLASYFDSAYAAAAARAGVKYVSVLGSLKNHELCSQNSWVVPVTGYGTNWLRDAKQGHPTGAGQVAIQRVVRTALGI